MQLRLLSSSFTKNEIIRNINVLHSLRRYADRWNHRDRYSWINIALQPDQTLEAAISCEFSPKTWKVLAKFTPNITFVMDGGEVLLQCRPQKCSCRRWSRRKPRLRNRTICFDVLFDMVDKTRPQPQRQEKITEINVFFVLVVDKPHFTYFLGRTRSY